MRTFKLLILLLVLIPLAGAQNEVFKQGEPVDFKKSCFNNGTFCGVTATCEVVFFDPNGNLLTNGDMTNQIEFHNFTLNNTQTKETGIYKANVVCTETPLSNFGTFTFEVTTTGAPEPDGFVKVLFYVFFAIFVGGFLITLMRIGAHIVNMDVDMSDMVWSISIFLAFFGFVVLQISVLNDPVIGTVDGVLLRVGAITHLLIPIIFFLISLFVGNLRRYTDG